MGPEEPSCHALPSHQIINVVSDIVLCEAFAMLASHVWKLCGQADKFMEPIQSELVKSLEWYRKVPDGEGVVQVRLYPALPPSPPT